eukprot:3096239-Prymnesium_polylepis.2
MHRNDTPFSQPAPPLAHKPQSLTLHGIPPSVRPMHRSIVCPCPAVHKVVEAAGEGRADGIGCCVLD